MPRHGSAFVGRKEELAFLAARRRETARGPQFILISGEAGVGKSRLLAEFRTTLAHRPVFVGYGECADVAPVPFGPFISIFRTLVPELAQRLAVASKSADRGENEKGALFDAARDALEGLGARRTTVVFLEDIHFADNGTLELLTHLARAVRAGRILVLSTYRTEPLHANERLLGAVARLARVPGIAMLDLPPLTETEARMLVASAVPDSVRLDAETVDAVVARAEGNAFFLEELVKHAVDRARHVAPPDEIPTSIQSVILERLASLDAHDRRTLAHAAILGRSFDFELLCRVLHAERTVVLPSLRRARDANLILEGPADSSSFSFRHGLTREAIVTDMLSAERRLLHADVLDVLEGLSPAARQRHVSDLAHHAFEAGDLPKAVRYNEEAGDNAVGVNAYDDAAQHYERALAAAPPSQVGRGALYRKAGDSLFWAGRFERAVRTYETALELALSVSDVAEAGRLHLQLARQHYLRVNSTDAMASARRAIDVLTPHGPRALRDLAALTLAALHMFRLEIDAASALLDDIRTLDDLDVAYRYHHVRAGVFALQSRIPEWKEECELFLRVARDKHSDRDLVLALHNIADLAFHIGQSRIAESNFSESMAVALRSGIAASIGLVASNYAYERYLAGDFEQCRSLVAKATSVTGTYRSGVYSLGAAAIGLGLALDDEPLLAEVPAEDLLESAFMYHQSQGFGPFAAAYAELLVAQGRADEARSVLHRAVTQTEHSYACCTMLVTVARHGDDADVARARDIARRSAASEPNPVYLATEAMVDALAARRHGAETESAAAAKRAAHLFDEIGWRWLQAEALELCGNADAAAALYGAIGHRRALRRLGSRAVGEHPVRKGAHGEALLSPRELDVVNLVASGNGNRAIAHALGIGEKTVEKHLSSAFAKLEVSSRTQLVASLSARAAAGPAAPPRPG